MLTRPLPTRQLYESSSTCDDTAISSIIAGGKDALDGVVERQAHCNPPSAVCSEILREAEEWERSEQGEACNAQVVATA